MKNKFRTWIPMLLIVLFGITLYLVEFSSYSSNELAKYNHGYGTFDMKAYDVEQVNQVLSNMEPKGFSVYRQYFVCDYLFILTFGALQLYLLYIAYAFIKSKKIKGLLYVIPVIRGIFDLVENTLLLIVLQRFPGDINSLVKVASLATQGKLWCIRIWCVVFLAGVVGLMYSRRKGTRK